MGLDGALVEEGLGWSVCSVFFCSALTPIINIFDFWIFLKKEFFVQKKKRFFSRLKIIWNIHRIDFGGVSKIEGGRPARRSGYLTQVLFSLLPWSGFLPVAKVSKCQQKVEIFIGQPKSQQFQAKVSNFYNYPRKPYLKIIFVEGGKLFFSV